MYFRVILSVLSIMLCAGIVQAAPFAYIANKADDTVSVLDTADNQVTAVIPVGDAPYGVAVNRMGSRVYVSNTGDNTISVIDTLDNSVTPISLTKQPSALAVNSAGTRLFVTNPYDDSVSIINAVTKNPADTTTIAMTAGCQPEGVVVGPPTAGAYRAYVSCYGTAKVAIIQATASETYTKSATEVSVPSGPRGIAISTDGKKIYVAGFNSSSIAVIDSTSLAAPAGNDIKTVGFEPSGVAVDPTVADSANSTRIYVTNMSDYSVSVIDSLNGSMTVTATKTNADGVGLGPQGIAFTADGLKAVTSNYLSTPGSVSVITKSTNNVTSTTGGTAPNVIGSSPSSFGKFAGPNFVSITTGVNDYNCGTVGTAELITADANGTYQVAQGQDVTFNITPLANCSISSVLIDNTSQGTPAAWPFTAVAATHDIYAEFSRNAWNASIYKQGSGSGTITTQTFNGSTYVNDNKINCGSTCSTTYTAGTRVRFLATAASGSESDGWLGACAGSIKASCDLTIDQATAILKGGESGVFDVGYQFHKIPGGPVRTNRGTSEQYKTLFQDAYSAVGAATTANPVDIDTSKTHTIVFNSNVAVTLVGGWTAYTVGGGTLPAGSASIINNGTAGAGISVNLGSLTIGSWGGNGAIIIH